MDDAKQARAPLREDLRVLCQQITALGADPIPPAMLEEMAGVTLLHAEGIVNTVRVPLVVLDATLHVLMANRYFYECFQVTPRETEAHRLYDLGNGQWNIPALRHLLEQILPHHTAFDDFEVTHTFPHIGPKTHAPQCPPHRPHARDAPPDSARHRGHHRAPAGRGGPAPAARCARRDAGQHRGCGPDHGHGRPDHLSEPRGGSVNRLAPPGRPRPAVRGGVPARPCADPPAAGESRGAGAPGRPRRRFGAADRADHPGRPRCPDCRPECPDPARGRADCRASWWSFATRRTSAAWKRSCGRRRRWRRSGPWPGGLPTTSTIFSRRSSAIPNWSRTRCRSTSPALAWLQQVLTAGLRGQSLSAADPRL